MLRPLTVDEQQTLRIFYDGFRRRAMTLAAMLALPFVAAAALGGVVLLCGDTQRWSRGDGDLKRGLDRAGVYLFAGGAAATIGLAVKLRRDALLTRAYRRDLDEKQVEVTSYTARRAAQLTLTEGPKSAFLVEVEAGGVLVLCGDYLDQAVEQRQFPATSFAIVRARHSRLALSLETTGPPLSDVMAASSHEALADRDGDELRRTLPQAIDELCLLVSTLDDPRGYRPDA
jgi:hypothetical protein